MTLMSCLQQYNIDQGNSNNVYSPRSPQSHKDAKQQNSQHLQAGMNSEINSQKPTNCNVDPGVQE